MKYQLIACNNGWIIWCEPNQIAGQTDFGHFIFTTTSDLLAWLDERHDWTLSGAQELMAKQLAERAEHG